MEQITENKPIEDKKPIKKVQNKKAVNPIKEKEKALETILKSMSMSDHDTIAGIIANLSSNKEETKALIKLLLTQRA